MSRKTVTFKMPVRDAAPPDEAQAGSAASGAEETAPASALAIATGGDEGASPSDQWVLHSDAHAEETAAPAAAAAPAIDLAAQRELPQAAALMFLIPPMVGWFWLFDATTKYWSAFAGAGARRASFGA